MNADRRILSPVAATLTGAVLVAAATLGGTLAEDAPARKGDRFATVGATLCAGEQWPNLTAGCLAWQQGDVDGPVRYITVADHDDTRGLTTFERVRDIPTN